DALREGWREGWGSGLESTHSARSGTPHPRRPAYDVQDAADAYPRPHRLRDSAGRRPDDRCRATPAAGRAVIEPELLLRAYASGWFPMGTGRRGRIEWFSPDPRGILPLDAFRTSARLRRTVR